MHHPELVGNYTHSIGEVLPQIARCDNACPPKDCDGKFGYKVLKEILMHTEHPEFKVPSVVLEGRSTLWCVT